MKTSMPLSNMQLELLKLYSTNLNNSELTELRSLLAKFFAQKAITSADQLWNEKKLDNNEMDNWLNEK